MDNSPSDFWMQHEQGDIRAFTFEAVRVSWSNPTLYLYECAAAAVALLSHHPSQFPTYIQQVEAGLRGLGPRAWFYSTYNPARPQDSIREVFGEGGRKMQYYVLEDGLILYWYKDEKSTRRLPEYTPQVNHYIVIAPLAQIFRIFQQGYESIIRDQPTLPMTPTPVDILPATRSFTPKSEMNQNPRDSPWIPPLFFSKPAQKAAGSAASNSAATAASVPFVLFPTWLQDIMFPNPYQMGPERAH